MHKKIWVLIIFILVVVACSGCSDKRPKYTNRPFEFFLYYNPTWEVKDRVGSAVVAFLAPSVDKSDYFQETLTITVQDMAKPIPLSEYTQSVTGLIKALGQQKDTTSNILESSSTTIAGNPAHKIIYTLTQYGNIAELTKKGIPPRIDEEGATIQMMLAWTIREQRVYLFTYVAQKKSYDIFVKDVDAMIQSFRFL